MTDDEDEDEDEDDDEDEETVMNVPYPAEAPRLTQPGAGMRAAILHGPGEVRVESVAWPRPEEDQLLIRIRNCGVCPSDVRGYTGDRTGSYPRMIGHEWCGEVVEIGPGVQGVAPGDRVVPDWRVICGECYECRRGVFNYCTNLDRDGVRGGYAEYGVAAARNVRKLPESVSFEQACFTEPLACCLNGTRMCQIRPGDDVVVLGCGQIGLMHLQLARNQGARVIAIDTLHDRLARARTFGADEIVLPGEDPIRRVSELTGGHGASAVIVAVGSTPPMEWALQMAGINGVVNFFAGTYPPATLPLDPNLIHYKQLRVTGSHDFTPHDFTTALKLIALRQVRVNDLISHVLPLDRIKDAFEMVAGRVGLKIMIEMS